MRSYCHRLGLFKTDATSPSVVVSMAVVHVRWVMISHILNGASLYRYDLFDSNISEILQKNSHLKSCTSCDTLVNNFDLSLFEAKP
jgi:hypothetical protein